MPLHISPILEDYMQHISRNGQTMLPWVYVKPLILQKYNLVVESFPMDTVSTDVEELKQRVFGVLKRLDGIPFTIQRICELLCAPNRQYTRLDKYLRGFEKVCRVVSTVDPRGNKIHHEDPRFPSQAGLEDCMTGDSLLSPNTSHSDGDEVTDEDVDNISSAAMETLLESADNVADAPLPTPTSPMWQMTSDTTPVSLGQTASDTLITSPHSDEVEPPLLRPIGQLEAFVQNIAADIPVAGTTDVPVVASTATGTTNQSVLIASSIAPLQMDVSEDGDNLEPKGPDIEATDDRSAGDSGDEPVHTPPVAGFKRRAPVSVDEALASSLGSLVEEEEAADGVYPTGGTTPVLDHTEEDHEGIQSPAKRRRITAIPGEGDDIPNFDPVIPCDRPAPDRTPPSSIPTVFSDSPPAIPCSRSDTTQSSVVDISSSSGSTDTNSVDVNILNSDEDSIGSRSSEGSAAHSD